MTSEGRVRQKRVTPPVGASEGDASRFLGVYHHALDEKGRVSFPIEFREVLASLGGEHSDRIVLTNYISDGARCIEGFPTSQWASFVQTLTQRSRFDPRLRQLENFYLSRAHECVLDSSGRIFIPPHLRTYAGLEREAVFTAALHGFRVWDPRVWELVIREAEGSLLENPELFMGIDLPSGNNTP